MRPNPTTRMFAAAAVVGGSMLGFFSAPAPATPAACTTNCSIAANMGGYLAPATEVASGTTVMFSSIQSTHPTDEAFPAGDSCFDVSPSFGAAPVPVRFDLVDGGLVATDPDGSGQCSSAVALPTGGQELTFRCRIHPWMFGSLVVT